MAWIVAALKSSKENKFSGIIAIKIESVINKMDRATGPLRRLDS